MLIFHRIWKILSHHYLTIAWLIFTLLSSNITDKHVIDVTFFHFLVSGMLLGNFLQIYFLDH